MLNGKILNAAFPINKVEVFFDNDDHSNFLGFKWERVGAGRVPVGIDINQNEFNTIGKLGGSKYLQEHNHKIQIVKSRGTPLYDFTAGPSGYSPDNAGVAVSNEAIQSAGTGDSGNLQPYIVMAFWKRIK